MQQPLRRQKSLKSVLCRGRYILSLLWFFSSFFFRGSSSVSANASKSLDKEFSFVPAHVDFSDSGLLRESSVVYTVRGNSYFSGRRYRRVSKRSYTRHMRRSVFGISYGMQREALRVSQFL